MSALPSSAMLIDGLRALSPRSLRYLGHRHLERHSLAETAAHFGISEEALRIHLLRSARELSRTLETAPGSEQRLATEQEELASALALESAVSTPPAPGASTPPEPVRSGDHGLHEVERLAALCLQLREVGPELLRGIEEAERAEFDSPRGRFRERLRLAAIAALVLLTLWMSLR